MSVLNPKTLSSYDGLMIYANTTRISAAQEKALLDFVEGGKALIPLHCASYCFLNSQKYIDLGLNYDSDGNTAGQDFTAKFSSMWQVSGDKVERLHIAREPNYDFSDPDDPVKNWPVWKAYQRPRLLHRLGPRRADLE